MKIKFKATVEQLNQMILNAINASIPVGLGILHFKSTIYTEKDLKEFIEDDWIFGVNIDYFAGRMVKLYIKKNDDYYFLNEFGEPRSDYQSWCHQYPTWESLLNSVGIKLLD